MDDKKENLELNKSEERIEYLENRITKMEENVNFLKDLLTHIHTQFEDFKKDLKEKK